MPPSHGRPQEILFLSCHVKPRDAKHDRLTLAVKHRVFIAPDGDDAGTFRNALAVNPRAASGSLTDDWGVIFNRPKWGGMVIRKTRTAAVPHPPPLFRGTYKFQSGAGGFQTQLCLILNPTRFLRYQKAEVLILDPANLNSSSLSYFKSDAPNLGGEESLDGNDNWLPNTPEFRQIRDIRSWERNYLEGVLRLINADVDRAADHETVRLNSKELEGADRFSLRTVETYFEFASGKVSPLWLITTLEPMLRSFSERGVKRREYPTEEPWDQNSYSLTMALCEGVTLKMYSKTNERIRIEIFHDLGSLKFTPPLSQTSANLEGIVRKLEIIRKDPAKWTNAVLRHLESVATIPATDKTPLDLLSDFSIVAERKGGRELARRMLEILLNKGCITSIPAFRSVLRDLRESGILCVQGRSKRRENVVTEQYRHGLQTLQTKGVLISLFVRHRTRGPALPRDLSHPAS